MPPDTSTRRPTRTAPAPWAGAFALVAAGLRAGWGVAGIGQGPGLTAILNPWYLARGSGFVAYGLLFLSVALGLLQSTGLLQRRVQPIAGVDVHGFASTWAIYATAFHFLILLYDRYVGFTLAEMLVPFTAQWRPLAVGLGTVAFYVMLVVQISTHLRPHLGARRWRWLHLTSLVAFGFTLMHGVMVGTESALPWVKMMYKATGSFVVLLVAVRALQAVDRAASTWARQQRG